MNGTSNDSNRATGESRRPPAFGSRPSRRAGIALGSNLGNRQANLAAGLTRLRRLAVPDAPLLLSKIYETAPVDCPPGSGVFLNAAVEMEVDRDPHTLLAELQAIERALGRPETRPTNAPRAIDLDILYYDDLAISDPDLTIPHPRLHERLFVLLPLRDICPERLLPGYSTTIREMAERRLEEETINSVTITTLY